jgi:hypothetical protein
MPLKFFRRIYFLGNLFNKFDSGIEILDDLEDHWTARHHKRERNNFIKRLQELSAQYGVRVTILGGDVHLAAVGQFCSKTALKMPKTKDHRYMLNIISSAIANRPPTEILATIINSRNKVHHFDKYMDETLIALFSHDVDGTPRRNTHVLPRRNWCSIREQEDVEQPANKDGEAREFTKNLIACLHVESKRGSPAGKTASYEVCIPTLDLPEASKPKSFGEN